MKTKTKRLAVCALACALTATAGAMFAFPAVRYASAQETCAAENASPEASPRALFTVLDLSMEGSDGEVRAVVKNKFTFLPGVIEVQIELYSSVDYTTEIGVCRTFVFFHEIEYLFKNNLIKGGDVDNAVVIVEHPVTKEQLEHMSKLFNVPVLEIQDNGYLSNISLRFANECARHKLLDLIGDLRLVGGFLKARVTAYKAGHTINTKAAKAVSDSLK